MVNEESDSSLAVVSMLGTSVDKTLEQLEADLFGTPAQFGIRGHDLDLLLRMTSRRFSWARRPTRDTRRMSRRR